MNAIYKFVMAQLAKSSAKKTGIATIQSGKGLNVELSVKQIEQTLKNMGVDISKITSPKEVQKFLNIQQAWLNQQIKQKAKNIGLMDPKKNIFMKKGPFEGFTPKVVPEPKDIKTKLEGMNKKTIERIKRRRFEAAQKAEREKMAKDPEYIPDIIDPEDFAGGGLAGMLGERTGYADGRWGDPSPMSPGTRADYRPGQGHRERVGATGSNEVYGPVEKKRKKTLDEIVAGAIGHKKDRPDFSGIAGMRSPMGRGPRGWQTRNKAANLFKTMFLIAKNSDKETSTNIYSAWNGVVDFTITNQATGLETDIAELGTGMLGIKEGIPTRIDENTIFDISFQTFDLLPDDLQATILASTNLAKDTDIKAILEDNDFGLEWNSKNQTVEGYFDVDIDSKTLKPTIIRPMFNKDNKNDQLTKQLFIGHGDFPPNPDNYPDGEMYSRAMEMWQADKNKEYFGLDLVSEPASDYKGGHIAFDTKNISGWAAVEDRPVDSMSYIEATGKTPLHLTKDKPVSISGSFREEEGRGKEKKIRADIPLPFDINPYIEKTTGDWKDELEYGVSGTVAGKSPNPDKDLNYLLSTGQNDIAAEVWKELIGTSADSPGATIGFTGAYNKSDDSHRIGADLTTELMGGNVGLRGWYDSDGNWHAGVGGTWTWGDKEKTKPSWEYGTSEPIDAYKFATDELTKNKYELFAGGGIAGMLGEPTYQDDNHRVPLSSGKFVFDAARRKFLQMLGIGAAGTAAAKSGLLSIFKGGGKKQIVESLTQVPIGSADGMPAWFPKLVNRVIKEGDDVTKKFATKDREIVHRAEIDKNTTVDVIQDLDTGNVRIEYDAADNLGYGPIQLDYKAGEIIEPTISKTGKVTKGTKTKPKFSAVESEPRVTNWDGDIEFDGENIVSKVDDLLTDTTKLETYATGNKPNIKKLLKSEQKKKYVKNLNDDVGEQIDYIENKTGHMAPEDLLDEMPDDIPFASGGRVPMWLGGGLSAGKSFIRELVKKLAKDKNMTGSKIMKVLNPKAYQKFLDDPANVNKWEPKTGLMASEKAKQLMKTTKEKRVEQLETYLDMAKSSKEGDKNIQALVDAGMESGMSRESAEKLAKGLREAIDVEDIIPKGVTDKTILDMEQMLKNLKTKDQKLHATGGRVSLSAGGLAGMLGE